MTKKVWISLPLITFKDPKEQSVATFLKGGQKKELEFEIAVFLTKWLMDRSVPLMIDFEASGVDEDRVLDALPRRLQRGLGRKPVTNTEAGGEHVAESPDAGIGDEPP